jgi:transcription-repair coupling factor (superfamily II helicase)
MVVDIGTHLAGAAPVVLFPADDVRPYDGMSPHPEIIRRRIRATMLLHQKIPCVVVCSPRAIFHKVLSAQTINTLSVHLKPGMVTDREQLAMDLVQRGYHGVAKVVEPGTLSSRGAVIDLWPTDADAPVRIEFFDDEIEEIRPLDPATQRSGSPLSQIKVTVAREAVPTENALRRLGISTRSVMAEEGRGETIRRQVLQDLRSGLWFPGAEDYLGAMYALDSIGGLADRVVVVEAEDVAGRLTAAAASIWDRFEAKSLVDRPLVDPWDRYLRLEEVRLLIALAHQISALAIDDAPDFGALPNRALFVGKGELAPVVGRIHQWLEEGWSVALVADSHTRAERIKALLSPHGLLPTQAQIGEFAPQGQLSLWIGALHHGFHCESAGLAIISVDELFGARRRKQHIRKSLKEATLGSVNELAVGDLVVHTRHGVGRFSKLKRIDLDGNTQEFAEVEYRGGDRMYLPVTRLDELYRYRSVGEISPRLDKLGGDSWAKRKAKVKDRVLRMAHELLEMHAQREIQKAFAYVGRPPAFQQFCETFPFEETPDQAAAIEEVLADLAKAEPMDRLVVGDVGFGKTEVAMRAAMRVAMEGHQVAILSPTSVLSFQHLDTFKKRFADTGLRVELLSSYRSSSVRTAVLKDIANGVIDIVIGTTSLLTRDLRFSHLGLIVVDEEHRFGVRQKHKLKQLSSNQSAGPVHTLAMSATPIPRTLHMALSGLRKVSLITTPPPERRSVQTRLSRFDDARIREDIRAELGRGGQVFFVHNRVASIEAMAARIRKQVPEASIAVAHGQMDKRQLERILLDFVQRKHHVLVCSTIIESGVDIPSVNTIIINRADELGMAQLYQLRGRVGRSHVRARCTLLIPPEAIINSTAKARLLALQEHSDLGSGFAIATRDMEVRGSGTLLGESQHGHIQAVGFDTYIELLEEAIATARGDMQTKRLNPEIEVAVPMLIPDSWMPELNDRLGAYRLLASSRSTAAVRSVLSEWEDRFGEPPPEVLNLGWAAEAKVRARKLGISHIRWKKIRVDLDFDDASPIPRARIVAMVSKDNDRFSLAPIPGQPDGGAGRLVVRFSEAEGVWPFRFLHWLFRQLEPSADRD